MLGKHYTNWTLSSDLKQYFEAVIHQGRAQSGKVSGISFDFVTWFQILCVQGKSVGSGHLVSAYLNKGLSQIIQSVL